MKLSSLTPGQIVAILVVMSMIFWFSPLLAPQTEEEASSEPTGEAEFLRSVQAQIITAEPITQTVTVNGNTAPGRKVTIRAEVAGKITGIYKDRGSVINTGEKILQIDVKDWKAKLKQANALVKQRELEYQGTIELKQKGLISQATLAESLAQLEAARADAKTQGTILNATTITAPFDGVLDTRPLELGDYVKTGDTIATILDYTPFIIKGEVSENDAPYIESGTTAFAELITGEKITGKIRYVSSAANDKTRTYEVEIEFNEIHTNVLAGSTAIARIPITTTNAHKISPALLTLNNKGKLGVKVLDENSKVRFYPIKIHKTDTTGTWVTGLPAEAHVITVGHAFTDEGEQVIAKYKADESTSEIGDSQYTQQLQSPQKNDSETTNLSVKENDSDETLLN